LICWEAQEKLYCAFEYCTELFKEEKIKRFISYFKEITGHVVKNKGILLKDITICHQLSLLPVNVIEMDFGF
jgi:hypothetical protein